MFEARCTAKSLTLVDERACFKSCPSTSPAIFEAGVRPQETLLDMCHTTIGIHGYISRLYTSPVMMIGKASRVNAIL